MATHTANVLARINENSSREVTIEDMEMMAEDLGGSAEIMYEMWQKDRLASPVGYLMALIVDRLGDN